MISTSESARQSSHRATAPAGGPRRLWLTGSPAPAATNPVSLAPGTYDHLHAHQKVGSQLLLVIPPGSRETPYLGSEPFVVHVDDTSAMVFPSERVFDSVDRYHLLNVGELTWSTFDLDVPIEISGISRPPRMAGIPARVMFWAADALTVAA